MRCTTKTLLMILRSHMPEHIPIAAYDKDDLPMISGKPCIHAIAFIMSIRGMLADYVDDCFSVHRFRAAYEKLIPSLPGKSQWPKADHGFFLAPPILKKSVGRPRTMRYKGCTEKGSKRSRRHKCPICKSCGHHWHNCKEGDPEQVAAMLGKDRGPPKKRRKKSNEATLETSIMAAPIVTPIMTYPPSQNIHFIEDSRNNSSGSSRSVRSRSLTGSNQPEPSNMIVVLPCLGEQTPSVASKKAMGKTKRKPPYVAPDGPAMGTRSKNKSPSMGTRSKRKLMD